MLNTGRLLELTSVTFDVLCWKTVFYRGYAKAGSLTWVHEPQDDLWDGLQGVCGPTQVCVWGLCIFLRVMRCFKEIHEPQKIKKKNESPICANLDQKASLSGCPACPKSLPALAL